MQSLSQENTPLEADRLVTQDIRDSLLNFSDHEYYIKEV